MHALKESNVRGIEAEEDKVLSFNVAEGGWTTATLPQTNWDGPLDQTSSQLARSEHILFLRDRLRFGNFTHDDNLFPLPFFGFWAGETSNVILNKEHAVCDQGWFLLSFEMAAITLPYTVDFTLKSSAEVVGDTKRLEFRDRLASNSYVLTWMYVLPVHPFEVVNVKVDSVSGSGTISDIHQVAYFHPEVDNNLIVGL